MKLLLVSISFPPKKDPECIQTGRYIKYLSGYTDLEIDVLTSKSPTLFMPDDDSLSIYDIGYRNKYELRICENRYLNFFQRKFYITKFHLPDSKAHFHLNLKKAIDLIKEKPDIIYSRSYPLSSAIMAFKLAEEFDVPWIMHLSDPWTDSPLHTYTSKELVYHSHWERKCFQRANYVSLTSDESINFYQQKYPEQKEKFVLFPNVFDSANLEPNPINLGNKLRIVYTGGLAGTRSPQSFLKALALLNDAYPLKDVLEVLFAGPLDRKMAAIVQKYDLPCFNHIGELSLNDSLELQRSAHILLIIDSPIENPNLAMFFPSKILEYLLSNRRMLAITDQYSTTASIIKTFGWNRFGFMDTTEIVAYLKTALEKFRQGEKSYFMGTTESARFDAKRNAGRLYELIKSV